MVTTLPLINVPWRRSPPRPGGGAGIRRAGPGHDSMPACPPLGRAQRTPSPCLLRPRTLRPRHCQPSPPPACSRPSPTFWPRFRFRRRSGPLTRATRPTPSLGPGQLPRSDPYRPTSVNPSEGAGPNVCPKPRSGRGPNPGPGRCGKNGARLPSPPRGSWSIQRSFQGYRTSAPNGGGGGATA